MHPGSLSLARMRLRCGCIGRLGARFENVRIPVRRLTSPSTPPSQAAANSTRSRVDAIISKLPPRLRPWATPLLHRPATHLTAFLLLHELTAILPLFTLFYAFHITHWNPSDLLPAEWVETGHARFKRYVERKGWDAKGWIDSRGLVELAAAYAVVKALMPVRVLVSLWGAPWFARVAVAPVVRLFGRFRK